MSELTSAEFLLDNRRVWVTDPNNPLGKSLIKRLQKERCELIGNEAAVDVCDEKALHNWLSITKPEVVVVTSALTGGIEANRTQPVEFLNSNVMLGFSIINAAARSKVEKLLYIGSSCFYPRKAKQPIKESSLLSGSLEPTNEAYALAKISGAKLCEAYRKQYGLDFITAVPTNYFGPDGSFDSQKSHVIPSLVSRFCEAKNNNLPSVTLWGTGRPTREFLYIEDVSDGLVFALKHYSEDEPVNIAGGVEVSISELAILISSIVGFEGEILTDPSKPDGAMRKVLSKSKLAELGWNAFTPLKKGLEEVYQDYLKNHQH